MSSPIKNASDLLKKHNITSIPIDVEAICREEGINISYADLREVEEKHKKPISGILLVTGDKKDIVVNKNDIPERKRFTIAHELGHYFRHYDHSASPDSMMISFRSARTEKEYEADEFAAKLLMPKEYVEEEYKKLTVPYISTLAKEFNVLKAAMAYRLDTLGMRYIQL